MFKKLGLILSTVLFAIAAFAFVASPAVAASKTVKMGTDTYQLKFDPSEVTVSPGDTIKFQNNNLPPHNIIFDQEPFKSLAMEPTKMLLTPSDSYTITVPDDAAAGTYTFFCAPHKGAGMTGKLIVQ
ncbi:MAG: plastocyanin [Cyanobacteria bacterium SBLK]|nr:plastocyanin [Cyanobacteria bacterium SBLK]